MRVIYALWLRQMKRYVRSPSRIVGAIGQPLLFLLALGYGLGAVVQKAGGGNYFEFLVPGIIAQTVLFSATFFGINIIFDRQIGYLKETLVAPVSRFKIMFGGALGGATTSTIQGCIVFIIAFILGFRPYSIPMLFVALLVVMILAIALTSFSSAIGSFVSDVPGFQSINQFIVFPLYFLSGSLYPLTNAPEILKVIATINPISYAVDALRACLINQSHYGLLLDFTVLIGTTILLVAFGVYRFKRIKP
jgi:ABC-2 type transport system permease protein